MKNTFISIALAAVMVFALAGCKNPADDDSGDASVTGVTLNKNALTLTVGESETLIPAIKPSNAANKKVSWSSSDETIATVANGVVAAIAEGTATITVTTEDGGFTDDCVVTVEAAPFDPGKPTPVVADYTITGAETVTYDGNAKTVTVVKIDDTKSPGAVTVLYNGNAAVPVNAGSYTVTFNVAAVIGWNAASGLEAGTLTINKASGAAVSGAPTAASVTMTSVTLTAVTLATATGQTVEYAKNTANSVHAEGWQDSTVFDTGITGGSTHFFFARAKENDNYLAGAASSGTEIKTITPITSAEISIEAPVKETKPETTASGTGEFSIGTVLWNPNDDPFEGGTVYTATVTLTANSGHSFTTDTEFTINGADATVSNNTGAAVTLSYTFAETDTRTVTKIEIKTPPSKLTYTHGETLDLTGLEVTLTFVLPDQPEDIEFENFHTRNITTVPAHTNRLVHLDHHGKPITIKGGGEEVETANNLTVNPKVVSSSDVTVDPINDQTYDGKAIKPVVTVKDGATVLELDTDYTVTYASNTDAGTNTAKVTITGIGNYTDSTDVYFTINPKVITFVVDAIDPLIYNGSPHTPTVTVKDGSTTLALTTDYTVAYTNNTDAGTATVTITGTGNYDGSEGSASFTINKATGAAVSAPTSNEASRTANSITLNAITTLSPSTGQSVEYARSNNTTAPTNDSDWKTTTTFDGLAAGTTYYFFARAKGNDNYLAGTASSGTEIKTKNTAVISLDVQQITDVQASITAITLSRTNSGHPVTQAVSVNAADYDAGSISWEIAGVGTSAGTPITGSGATFTLNAADVRYNSLGVHALNLTVTRNGTQYQRAIPFTIAQ